MKEINVPYYTFWLPKFKIINKKIKMLRGPAFMVTPVSISYMKLGDLESVEGKVFANVYLKSLTLYDLPFILLRVLCFLSTCLLFIWILEGLK